MSTVLITGAAGFLGKSLTETLLKRGHTVVGTVHSELSLREFERTVSRRTVLFPRILTVEFAVAFAVR